MNKLLLPAMAVAFVFSTALAEASEVSDKCVDEIVDLLLAKENLNFSDFSKELAVSVVKVQGSCKTPVLKTFLCPANDKITDIGLTAGCVKELPTEPEPLKSLLMKVSLEMLKGMIADKLGVERSRLPNNMEQLKDFALELCIEKASAALGIEPDEVPKNMKELKELLSERRNIKEAEDILSVLSMLGASSDKEEKEMPKAPAEKDTSDNLRGYKRERKFSLGIRLGGNDSFGWGTNGIGDATTDVGVLFGIILDIPITDWLYFQPGFRYMRKTPNEETGPLKTKLYSHTVSYFVFPTLASFKYSRFSFDIGPYYAFYTGRNDGAYNSDYNLHRVEGKDWGISTGIGIDFWKLYFGLFFSHGFVDLERRNDFKYYNRDLGFALGVNF